MLFILPQKLFSFSIYLNLCLDVTAWLTNNCNTHISNISGSKGNQTMKFNKLIEYNMRNIFLEKSHTKCCGETSPRPFPEKFKLSISLD